MAMVRKLFFGTRFEEWKKPLHSFSYERTMLNTPTEAFLSNYNSLPSSLLFIIHVQEEE
jgi:hypothetical protein